MRSKANHTQKNQSLVFFSIFSYTSLNMEPNTWKEHPQNEIPREPIISLKKRALFFIGIITLMLFGGCIIVQQITQDDTYNSSEHTQVTLEPKKPEGLLKRLGQFVFNKQTPLEGQKDDRINILLLGMGGQGHDGPYLTDTIILVSIKPSTNEIAMISIPRDLGVTIPGYGIKKINHANAFGEAEKPGWGAAKATEIIEKTFEIDIQYYGRIDFAAFEQMIEEVDGITVNVEKSFVDLEYPAPNEQFQTVSFQKGIQVMDGKTALTYARSRHGNNGEGSDFARSKRQQQILLALKEKVLSTQTLTNPIKIKNIIETLDTHITTNMEFSDMLALLKLAKELDTSNIIRLTIDDSEGGYLTSGSTLLPKSGTFDGINYAIKHIFDDEAEVIPPNISVIEDTTPDQKTTVITDTINIAVLNGTWHVGLAARVKKTIEEKNIPITTVGNTNTRPIIKSGIYVLNKDIPKDIQQHITTQINLPQVYTSPPSSTIPENTDMLIVLGEDFIE